MGGVAWAKAVSTRSGSIDSSVFPSVEKGGGTDFDTSRLVSLNYFDDVSSKRERFRMGGREK